MLLGQCPCFKTIDSSENEIPLPGKGLNAPAGRFIPWYVGEVGAIPGYVGEVGAIPRCVGEVGAAPPQ